MKTFLHLSLYGGLILLIHSCASVKPYYKPGSTGIPSGNDVTDASDLKYSLYLVGGLSLKGESPVLKAIDADRQTSKSGLVLLGDVLSVDDLPAPVEGSDASTAEEINMIKKLDASYNDLFLIPGQKEWSSEKKVTSSAIGLLDRQLKDVRDKGRFIEPRKGCGTPEVIRITDNTILVLVDSQWAIESESRSGEKINGCELGNVIELKQAIKGIIQSHLTDHIIIATHHPIYANGKTASNYPVSSHLIPLPVIGTIITGIKMLVGSNQHFGHPAYEAYRSAFISAIEGCKNCVVVSGHEKNLQYFENSGQHYLVAGSGDKVGYARKGDKSGFSYMSRGFVRADVMQDGRLHVSFIALDDTDKAHPVWEMYFINYHAEDKNKGEVTQNSSQMLGDSILMSASTLYGKKKFLRGDFYRKAWSQQIEMSVLHLDEVHGGLKPLQLGGGNQTRSLRLVNAAGEQYVLRSVDKKVTAVLPPALRGTFAENIVQDGIAASHPYGALVVPPLAVAADIYHTNPSIVYVPHQSTLGIYDRDIGDGVYSFEERPGGNTSNFTSFGSPQETFNTLDVVDMVIDSRKYKVDQKSVVRARLFDIWLGDWDRHDDQVRWAAFKENDMTVFRPIPRDRDQVFFKNDGILDYLASRPYFNPPLRRFDEKIDYLPGLIWAGKYFDRSFMHELTEEDFVAEAKKLQADLSDQVIDEAFTRWPKEIDTLDGKEIRHDLRIRRDDLVDYAREYYRLLSKQVKIPGTDDQDIFTINATDDHHLNVIVDRMSGSGVVSRFYERTFDDDATEELQLFGLSKDDSFHLEGTGKPDIRIRIVGGTGEDELSNESSHLHVLAYDVPEGMEFSGDKVSDHLNNKPFNNTYDRTDWSLNKFFHFPSPAYYTDEGFGLTYTFWMTRYGFRSDPFKSRHALSFSYYFNTEAYIGKYTGEWLHALGDVDFGLDIYNTGPTYIQFYYGLGNEYIDYGENNKYHIVKGGQIKITPSLGYRFGFGSRIFVSPGYHYLNIRDSDDDPRFVYTPESGLTEEDFGKRHYLSLTTGYQFERLDNPGYPTRGGDFEITAGGNYSLSDPDISHGLFSASGSLYIPFDVSGNFVLATHIQADKIVGDYEFFHALTLGGPDKFRGFRRDRLAGDARMFQSTDLRIKLIHARGMVPFGLGIYGAFDYGRVWYDGDDESADTWHKGFGGGIFVVPFSLTAFRIGFMQAEKDEQINIGGSLRF